MAHDYFQLSVGHSKFVVSKNTLLKYDGSYFAKLFSERFNNETNDVIYIDRDGTHFNAILNYLRGCLELDHWTSRDLQELAIEANYYSLPQLEDQIDKVLKRQIQVAQYQRVTQRIKFDCHLMNPVYKQLLERLNYQREIIFVIFVRSEYEMQFQNFFAVLEGACLNVTKEIELTFVYDVFAHQKIQMFLPKKGCFKNVCMLPSLDILSVDKIARELDWARRSGLSAKI